MGRGAEKLERFVDNNKYMSHSLGCLKKVYLFAMGALARRKQNGIKPNASKISQRIFGTQLLNFILQGKMLSELLHTRIGREQVLLYPKRLVHMVGVGVNHRFSGKSRILLFGSRLWLVREVSQRTLD